MWRWFGRQAKPLECQAVVIPGQIGTIVLPSTFRIEFEDDTTVLAYATEANDISLRVSSISVTRNPGVKRSSIVDLLRKTALENGHEFREDKNRGIAFSESESEENGIPLVAKHWQIACNDSIVFLSASIIKSKLRSTLVQRTLATIPIMIDSVNVTIRHEIIEDGDRTFETTVSTVDLFPHTVVPFGSAELRWLRESTEAARDMSLKYGSGGELDPVELDRVFSRWMSDDAHDESDEQVANALGAAFGSYFVENHEFGWVTYSDEHGSEFAIRHPAGQTTAFPRDSVYKRIESKCPEFFDDLSIGILHQLQNAKSGK